MLVYFINSTVIWSVSLLFYFFFLRRETFFHWNRVYLNGTFILGLMMPLFSFGATSEVNPYNATVVLHRSIEVKEKMIQPLINQHFGFNIAAILCFLFICGSAISVGFILKEISLIYRFYRRGKVYPLTGWTIIETNCRHTPFSWGKFLFITTREQYSAYQFDIIVAHEAVHRYRMHYADILLLAILQSVCWFHPLFYVYRYLIRLTHEFEADSLKKTNTETYGHFLISEAMGAFQPRLMHTFSSSPLKNRIIMLTQKKSTRLKAMKYLAILPVLLISFIMVGHAQKKLPLKKDLGEGKFEYYGNSFANRTATAAHHTDVVQFKDRNGQETAVSISPDGMFPDIMNGEPVYNAENAECTMPVLKSKEKDLSHDLYNTYKKVFAGLPDNEYEIHMVNFIINRNGKVVFIERLSVGGISVSDFSKLEKRKPINDDTAEKLKQLSTDMTFTLLNDVVFKPGMRQGKAVHAKYWESGKRWKIVVSGGQTRMVENNE